MFNKSFIIKIIVLHVSFVFNYIKKIILIIDSDK